MGRLLAEGDETHCHLLISLWDNATNCKKLVASSIDFAIEEDRWQIIREIFITRNAVD